ncbi:hypothetical protein [Nocardioides sp.]|uniref:DUF1643 domain-containing protein n=1 Tax=Nocardioides sp. TaxID=35761 RepID=UPI0035169F42
MSTKTSTLLAVLTNPPTTPGERTLARVQLACDLLGYDDFAVANLFPLPSRSTRDINELGQVRGPWLAARPVLQEQLGAAAGVLLAYGLERPRGQAGQWHREQVTWLDAAITGRGLPRFWVGEAPRHPSRWQRCTSRRQPAVPFRDAVALELRPAPGGGRD